MAGAWCEAGSNFFDDLGNRISDVTGDCNETAYLYQRLSIAIQRGNAACFNDCFENSDIVDHCT